jgi:peptide/nickel transport system substrate-binding protein
MLRRRKFLQSAGSLLASPAVAASETSRVFHFTPQVDVSSLDPVWTPNYQTLYHAFMVFDTLFGVDTQLRPQPQMALGAATEEITAPDDRTVMFRLHRPFPLLPDALGKMNPNMCPIMPE